MIRINLLPIKTLRRREIGRNVAILFLLCLLGEILVLFGIHQSMKSKIVIERRRNHSLKANIARYKKEIGDPKKIEEELKEIQEREEIISELKAARTGPVYMLTELSNILSPGKGPSLDRTRYLNMCRENPGACINFQWDSRRVWITEFKEKERTVVIRGEARSHEDVAEFHRRLNLSDYFYKMDLIQTEQTKSKELGIEYVKFEIQGKVRYK
jgi:type IV pilus assembly protein PilN